MKGIYDRRVWFILEGFLVGVVGLAALVLAGLFSPSAGCLYGLAFLITGVIVCLRSLITFRAPGILLSFFSFAVYLVAGIILLNKHPVSLSYLLIFLPVIFWILALTNFLISLLRFKSNNWGFLFVSSVVTAVIGVLIILQPISSSPWAISILVGGHFIIYGACQFMTGATAVQNSAV